MKEDKQMICKRENYRKESHHLIFKFQNKDLFQWWKIIRSFPSEKINFCKLKTIWRISFRSFQPINNSKLLAKNFQRIRRGSATQKQ
jgi:hypothetical protein